MATRVSCARRAARLQRHREDRHDLVAVDLGAGGVHREAPVGVAVVGDAEVGAPGEDGGLEVVEVGRAVAVVDVEAVRLGADLVDLGPGQPEHLGRDRAGRAVGAVDDDLDARRAGWAARRAGGRCSGCGRRGMVTTRPTSAPVGRSHSWSSRAAISSSIWSSSLCPPAAKNLMPLSGIALCEAESITPKSAWVSAVRNAIAGVGSTLAW